ncbi:MAG: ABC transporter substrate-binding protein [Clostridiales bacterium]|nr:ABC transporter substrate-binding protein [Clostridiales bacterium]
MKKVLAVVLALVLVLGLVACGGGGEDTDATVIKVGASPVPHAEILNAAADILAAEGYTLEVVEFQDYVLPNEAVSSGECVANYFQHVPYLDQYNAENGTDLVSAAMIHYEPYGIYAGKSTDLAAIPEGAQIAVPNDATNEARALQLLAQEGIITLTEGVGIEATILDIVDNPYNVEIVELEAAMLPRSLQDVDFAVINGNYAMEAGLNAAEDALAIEAADSIGAETFGNIICVAAGNEELPEIQALVNALKSDEIKAFIEETYAGAVVPVF